MTSRAAPDPRLHRLLRRYGRRLRAVEGLHWTAWGLAVGLALGLALALVARAIPLLPRRPLVGLAGLLALAGAWGGLSAALLRPRPVHRLARILDRRLSLAERLTTALEVGEGRLRTSRTMAAAQLADTLRAAAHTDIHAALELRAPRRPLLVGLLLAAGLTLSLLLPNPQEQLILQQAAAHAAITEQVEALEAVREEIAQSDAISSEERAALLQALEETLTALEEGQAAPEEAIAALAAAERSLAPLQDPGAADLRTGLERAAGEMADSELARPIAASLARGDYAAAAEALASFAGEEGEALTREQELELARELAQAAETLAQVSPELAEQLAEAAAAIEQGDIARARQAIQQAAAQMRETGQRVEGEAAVEQTLAALQEGREQIAQASGQQASTAGQQAGASGQQASTAGQQAGASGQQAGATGQQAAGQTGGQQAGTGAGQQGHHEDSGSSAPYDPIYAPERLEGEGGQVEIDRQGEGGLPTGDTPLPAPQSDGRTAVPYSQVYAHYAAQAHAALESSYIPLGMKQYVRDYFSSLEP